MIPTNRKEEVNYWLLPGIDLGEEKLSYFLWWLITQEYPVYDTIYATNQSPIE